MVVDFAACNHRDFRIQEVYQTAENSALGLSAQSQKYEIVARKQRIDDLRYNRVFVAMHAGEKRFVALDTAQQIAANLILH